ncbi:MAG: three-Cys-motif partner protein TcmP [Prevotellaceae bacterium]|jgi:three-Cys-motif partner protein|nr:three-Cys-motif partner protein TcmP [Prevotellaceae bacterium]
MARKDLYEKPFDEGTITKLEIFENYAKEWIPTFVMGGHKELWIFDFFAGIGYGINGVSGSPIRILQQILNQAGNIFQKKTKINVCFNEFDKDKFDLLQTSCNQFVTNNPELSRMNLNMLFRNCDFADLFPKTLSTIKKYPSLVYLDQNGMKFLADKYIDDLEKTSTTDFLYYLSSSYFVRFGRTKAFQTNMNIDIERARRNPYKYIHKSILEQLREKLPQKTKLSLYPFTIKKNANVYGIIFGATHPRAVDKFLKTAWDKNTINGEANFDIDDDKKKSESTLFPELKLLTKIEVFQQTLKEKILNGSIKNNKEAFDYTLQQGHISEHATEAVKELKNDGKLLYDARTPLINYDNVYKNNKIIKYKVITP